MKKVFVHAYLSYNLGDDLMVWLLCKRYPRVQFYTIADERYKTIFRELPNMKVFVYNGKKVQRWNRFWKKVKGTEEGFRKMLLKTVDATIHIGGSSFVQHFDDYSAFYLTDAVMRNLSKRMYAIGMNFGPYTDEHYYRDYYQLLGTYDGVTFRDHVSYQLFEQLPNVKQAADVVFNYGKYLKKSSEPAKKQVLISLIRMEGRDGKFAISPYSDSYRAFLLSLSKEYLKKGYEIRFISFCGPQGDDYEAEQLMEHFQGEDRNRVSLYRYESDIEACIRQFDEAEIVVGTRFHSIILGWLKGKKVLPIVYDEKTQNIMDDFQYSEYIKLDELETADVAAIVERVHGMDEEQVQRLVADADRQFWASDLSLKEK